MFIWTISDAIGVVVALLLILFFMAAAIPGLIRQLFCKHDGGVSETMACDAICRKCGKNLGFIGAWRKRATSDEGDKHG